MYHVPRILSLLREKNSEDIVVILGGTIPPEDAAELKRLGVRGIFSTDSDTGEAIRLVQGLPARGT